MTIFRSVAIIGAGFSGSLLAINILRHAGPATTLIERSGAFGRGTAYGTAHPSHLLNVRAGNMSALRDRPDHFAAWCRARGLGDSGDFLPRRAYGDYLAELLAATAAGAGDRLEMVTATATAARVDDDGVTVEFAGAPPRRFGALVLANGNLPPHPPAGIDPDALGPDRWVNDPWAGAVAAGLGAGDTVLLLGTGLTMVDVALMLDAQGFGGRIVAMSRRGLLPHPHAPATPAAARLRNERPTTRPAALLADVRARADTIGWRAAVDELRPFTQTLWLAASAAERRRFLRHLRPWWDIHRHRLAPVVAARIAALIAAGRLTIIAGKPQRLAAAGAGTRVDWRRRGGAAVETLAVRRIVNCTGPQGDLARSPEPVLQSLIAAGHARADAQRLGLDVDAASRLIGADGTANPRLFGLGPMTRGAFWEIVAVPDIRVQVWSVARWLAQEHWVGGEGL